MLLLYRVEGRNEPHQWETIRICRPPYRKTETFKTECYGFLKLKKKRQVVTSCVIHNQEEASEIAFSEAQKYMHKNRDGYQQVRIAATHLIEGDLETFTVDDGD